MTDSIPETKVCLRQNYRRLRKELGDELRAHASRIICGCLENWSIFQKNICILTYMPIKGEADLTALLGFHPEKRWVLPRIIPEENHRMLFHLYDADHLVMHPFGMAEPTLDQPAISPEEIQLVLVPGLAYDRNGWRLGYGGGYFDRFLRGYSGVSVGITFRALLLDQLPHDLFDVPVQWIVTEQGILKSL